MKEQLAVQKILRRKLHELQKKNPKFSVRAFAIRLGIQPSAANEILRGDRRVSRKMAERLAGKLHLDPSERAEFLGAFPKNSLHRRPADHAHSETDLLRLTHDQFELISDWIHFGILNLIKTVDCSSDLTWMARRLGTPESKVRVAIERLSRMGLLARSTDGPWVRLFARINTSDDVASISIQKSHLQDMDLARESLIRHPTSLRDFSSMTIALSPSSLPQAKEILRRAQDEIAALAESLPATEVYRLSHQLFPLTQIKTIPSTPKESL